MSAGYMKPCERFDCRTQKARIGILEDTVKELKARLKACREAWYDPGGDHEDDERIPRATDLRRKNWRKP